MGSGLPEAKLLCSTAPLHAFKGSRAPSLKFVKNDFDSFSKGCRRSPAVTYNIPGESKKCPAFERLLLPEYISNYI